MIIVSFCLPVYNRSQHTFAVETNLLKYEGNDIQIVVSDDNSMQQPVIAIAIPSF